MDRFRALNLGHITNNDDRIVAHEQTTRACESITEKRVWQLRRLPDCPHVPGPTQKLLFLRSSMSQIPERSDRGDRCSGWGHFWGVIWGSRCFKKHQLPPAETIKSQQTYLSLQVEDKYRRRRHFGGEISWRESPGGFQVYVRIWVSGRKNSWLPSSRFLVSSTVSSHHYSSLPSRMQHKVSQNETNYFRWVPPPIWRATTSVVNAEIMVLQSQYFFIF